MSKQRDKSARGQRLENRMLLLGIGLAVLYWIIESFMESLLPALFDNASFTDRLLVRDDPNELWMRGTVVILLIGFSLFAQIIIAKRQRAEEEVGRLNEDLENRVAERTAQLEAAVAELRESEKRFRSLVQYGSDIITVLEADGTIRYESPAVEGVLGYRPEELIGTNAFDGIHPDDLERVVSMSLGALHTPGVTPPVELRWRHKDGSWRALEVIGNNLLDDPSLRGVVLNSRDITERKQAEAEVRRLNEVLEQRVRERTAQLKAANSELEAFSYSVSHDLRAPLRAIGGFSQTLLEDYEDRLDEEGKDYLRRVGNASQRMKQLIDGLLNLSRATRGEMRRETVDLSALAREIAEDLRNDQPERWVEFTISEGLTASGDQRLLRVVLENLMGNAWKFTAKQSPARIELGAQQGNGTRAYFVRDNGVGFDMSYADRLFGVFQRLHGINEFEGTGIGLATVQRIIRRHGGDVWAEGSPGRGATFFFSLDPAPVTATRP